MNCVICNTKDLFSAVTMEKVCSVCKVKYIGGLPTTDDRIAKARKALGLQDGEFLQHDHAQEARNILGR